MKIVLLGAGHANLEVLAAAVRKPLPNVSLTLISKNPTAIYSGMAAGVIAGVYRRPQASISLQALCAAAKAEAIFEEVKGLDPARSEVWLASGARLSFDAAAINTGSGTGKAPARAIAVKPFEALFDEIDAIATGPKTGECSVAIAGGGAGAVEIAFALEWRFQRRVPRSPVKLTLVTDDDDILLSFPKAFRKNCKALLMRRGVSIQTGSPVIDFDGAQVFTADGRRLQATSLIWAVGPSAGAWLRDSGLSLDWKGFALVSKTLQAIGYRKVFVAGDAASFETIDVAKSGLYAVREGELLSKNLRRLAEGKPLLEFKPQTNALYLLSTGGRRAVGTRNGFTFRGRLAWWLKDYIDRGYIGRFPR